MSHAISEPSRWTTLRSRVSVYLFALGIAGLSVLNSGCAFRVPVPENFVERDSSWQSLSALTAEEDKFLVRHFVLGERQTLKFWTEAVRYNLVQERGHTLIEEKDFKTQNGVPGHRFLFELSMNDVPYRYLLVVFSTQGWWRQHIYTVEFLSEKKDFEKHAPAVEKAIEEFRPLRGRVGQVANLSK